MPAVGAPNDVVAYLRGSMIQHVNSQLTSMCPIPRGALALLMGLLGGRVQVQADSTLSGSADRQLWADHSQRIADTALAEHCWWACRAL